MMQEKPTKLSLNVRKMKFMQRCLSEDARRLLDDGDRRIITNEHWELDFPSVGELNQTFTYLESVLHCQPCHYGRMSFGGFNKNIEKLMIEMNTFQQDNDVCDDSDASISDDEMAKRFTSLVNTVSNKYKKRVNTKKGRKIDKQGADAPILSKVRRKHSDVDHKGFMKPSN